uniref:Uncharacterized protein n=1 Tax=Phage sp. ctesc4 TaxID=2828008 RepID=A0A8S5TCM0_9VIRU|nr:MAG TPA: hypothetical protein [Phage sp. ctesc4]
MSHVREPVCASSYCFCSFFFRYLFSFVIVRFRFAGA